jgi:hypothetical protein
LLASVPHEGPPALHLRGGQALFELRRVISRHALVHVQVLGPPQIDLGVCVGSFCAKCMYVGGVGRSEKNRRSVVPFVCAEPLGAIEVMALIMVSFLCLCSARIILSYVTMGLHSLPMCVRLDTPLSLLRTRTIAAAAAAMGRFPSVASNKLACIAMSIQCWE